MLSIIGKVRERKFYWPFHKQCVVQSSLHTLCVRADHRKLRLNGNCEEKKNRMLNSTHSNWLSKINFNRTLLSHFWRFREIIFGQLVAWINFNVPMHQLAVHHSVCPKNKVNFRKWPENLPVKKLYRWRPNWTKLARIRTKSSRKHTVLVYWTVIYRPMWVDWIWIYWRVA